MSLDLNTYLAIPGQPQLVLATTIDEDASFSKQAVEEGKAAFQIFCRSVPNLDGASWRILAPYLGGNGSHARAFIALGAHYKFWEIYPPITWTDAWPEKPRMAPFIAAGSLALYGDKADEATPVGCECCDEILPPDWKEGDFKASTGMTYCSECVETCANHDSCQKDLKTGPMAEYLARLNSGRENNRRTPV